MFCRALVPSVLAILAAGDTDCEAKTEIDEVGLLQSRIFQHRESLNESGSCCFNSDCTGCNPPGHFCNEGGQERCEDTCHGQWCQASPSPPPPPSDGSCCFNSDCTGCNPPGHFCNEGGQERC